MKPIVLIWGDQGEFGNYARMVQQTGGIVCLSKDMMAWEHCDALLLPGGGDLEPWRYGQKNVASCNLEPRRDDAELELLERFTALKRPVLGICRGIQTINVFFGGTLCQDLPGHQAVAGIDRVHKVYTAPSFLSDCCGEESIVNSAHHQAIDHLGSGLQAVQWAPDGTIEAVQHKELSVWGVQWHPERLKGEHGTYLFHRFLSRRVP